jgi:hypothetical protein
MGRLRLVAFCICWCCSATMSFAQVPVPPEGWVVLPVDEYRALRDKASPAPPGPAAPPVDATLTRVDYDLRVDNDMATGRALVSIDVLREGWTRVQIPAGLMVRDARLDGQPLSLVKGPAPQVLLSRQGRSVLTLEIAIPITSSAGSESIVIPASPSTITRTMLSVPRSGVDLSVVGGFVTDHSEATNESRWTTYGRPNQLETLAWKRKVDDRRAELPLRVRAHINELVELGEETGQTTTGVRIEVLQGLAREVTLSLPDGLAINQVDGATVGDWDIADRLLHVRLLDPVSTEVSFVVQAEARTPRAGSITVPLVRMPSAERETGGVAVSVVGAGEIGGRQAHGFDPADPSELGEVVIARESPSMVAFRMKPMGGRDDRALAVNVVRYTPQAVLVANVEEARYRALVSEDGRLLVEARYAVRNNQRGFLEVTLPPDSSVWSAEISGRPVRPGAAGNGTNAAVLLPLSKSRAGEEASAFVVSLVYLQRIDRWVDKGRAHIVLPALDLPISRTGLEIYYSPRFQVQSESAAFHPESDPGTFADALSSTVASSPPPAGASTAAPRAEAQDERVVAGLQALIDQFKKDSGGRTVVGSLPVHITFPRFGSEIFLASELTAEAQSPSVDLSFRRNRR